MSTQDTQESMSTQGVQWYGVVTEPTKDQGGEFVPGSWQITPMEFVGQPDAQTKSIACTIGGGGSDGVGSFPGQRIRPGQRVIVSSVGQQAGVIVTTIPDHKTTDQGGDNEGSSSWVPTADLIKAVKTGEIPDGLKKWGNKIFGKENIRDISKADAIRAIQQFARENRGDISFGGRNIFETQQREHKNPLRNDQKQGTPGKHPKLPKSIGAFATTLGSLKNPTSFIEKQIGKKGELIPGAFDMIKNLKSAGSSGTPIDAADMVGGLSNWQNALAGIASARASQQNEPKDETDYLCELFKELFPDFECRIDDIETEFFQEWKRKYLKELEDAIS